MLSPSHWRQCLGGGRVVGGGDGVVYCFHVVCLLVCYIWVSKQRDI